MFSAKDIEDRVKRRPFRPFRIVTSSGNSVDVPHPELVLISQRFLAIGIATEGDPLHFDRETRVSILHINALEDLPVNGRIQGNGNH